MENGGLRGAYGKAYGTGDPQAHGGGYAVVEVAFYASNDRIRLVIQWDRNAAPNAHMSALR